MAGVEVFLTVLSLRGSGPITEFVTRRLWGCVLAIHKRWRCHRLLALVGPALIVIAVLVWYALIIAGWLCIFLSAPANVIDNTGGHIASVVEKFYFIGATISSVGYGDFVPDHFPWTLLANLSAFTATFFVTVALSYFMPVISAALDRRQIAASIFAMGKDPVELVANSWTKGNSGIANTQWGQLFVTIEGHALKNLVYPVLRFFHCETVEGSSARAILNLADAVFLVRQTTASEERPPPAFFLMADSAIGHFAELRHSYIAGTERRDGKKETAHLHRRRAAGVGDGVGPGRGV